MTNFHQLEVVGRVSETQLQVGGIYIKFIQFLKVYIIRFSSHLRVYLPLQLYHLTKNIN